MVQVAGGAPAARSAIHPRAVSRGARGVTKATGGWQGGRRDPPKKVVEATGGFEPPNEGFAGPCLTTWLRRRAAKSTGQG